MKDQEDRRRQLQEARDRYAQLGKRTLDEIAHEVGIKGLVSDMVTMGTEDWERTRSCLFWILNHTDYPYDKTVLELYADLDAVIKGHGNIRFI
ncbi:hypothetical protein IQ277_28070 [Nostocales cyanobacterium LEGE 12452]|nr:hypothetical protein [Nostocales cyanobacterium LEGE 12452]